MLELINRATLEQRTYRVIFGVIGIPTFWLVIFAFTQRKRALCAQRFGAGACRRSGFSHAFLALALFLCILGIFRTRRAPPRDPAE
jgi:hypothetical protein